METVIEVFTLGGVARRQTPVHSKVSMSHNKNDMTLPPEMERQAAGQDRQSEDARLMHKFT